MAIFTFLDVCLSCPHQSNLWAKHTQNTSKHASSLPHSLPIKQTTANTQTGNFAGWKLGDLKLKTWNTSRWLSGNFHWLKWTDCIWWIWVSHAHHWVKRYQVMTWVLLRAKSHFKIYFNVCPSEGHKTGDVKATCGLWLFVLSMWLLNFGNIDVRFA